MNTYYVRLMGNDIIYVDQEQHGEVARAIEAGKNITYKGRYIANHQIVDAGPIKLSNSLESDFEQAQKLLASRPPHDPNRRAGLKDKIRKTLSFMDTAENQKREYLAATAERRRLKALQTEEAV